MNNLFSKEQEPKFTPLAERMRPCKITDIYGQTHLLGENMPLTEFFRKGEFPSIIFWGPPGCGKTTLAMLIAFHSDYKFIRISAVESGVKDLRRIIDEAEKLVAIGKRTLLFIDEIHRFNKSQQDALLHSVETGLLVLVGATTENPSFEINSALMSRCQIYRLEKLNLLNTISLIDNSLKNDVILSKYAIKIDNYEDFFNISAGDARTTLNTLEIAFEMADKSKEIIIDNVLLERALQHKVVQYDKKGDNHYDTISAFIKSLRGSDPDAAMIWLAKMLEAGEDPKFIARRMVIFASEDVGNADVYALTLTISVFNAVTIIGMPECRINLAHGVTYLASCPKSNASYMAYNKVEQEIRNGLCLEVPLHLRNAPTPLMKKEGFGANYKYPHDFEDNFVDESYFPIGVKQRAFYSPGEIGKEKTFKERLRNLWKSRY
ncbi:MAG: replication-associated recombination protein A [bacterium]